MTKAFCGLHARQALAYLAELRQRLGPDGKPLAERTFAHRRIMLKRVWDILETHRLVNENPWAEIGTSLPPPADYLKRPTQPAPVEKLKELLSRQGETPAEIQEQAILAVGYLAALRRAELHSLRIKHVRWSPGVSENALIELDHTKARKAAMVAISGPLTRPLFQWLRWRRAHGAQPEDPLWVNLHRPDHPQMGYSTIYEIWRRTIGVSPHSTRATACTRLLRQGYSPAQVQQMMRLSSPRMVEVYDRRDQDERIDQVKQILVEY